MSLHQYYQFEQQNAFFDLSAGSIKDFDFFNIHSSRQEEEEEFDGTKVVKQKKEYSFFQYILLATSKTSGLY